MKKTLNFAALLVIFFIINLVTSCMPPEIQVDEEEVPQVRLEGHKRSLAVMSFENESSEGGDKIGSAVADKLISQLMKLNSFTLIERSELDNLILEQGLAQSGMITEESGVEAGKLLGVQALLVGKVHEFSTRTENGNIGDDENEFQFKLKASLAKVTLSYKLLDAMTGEILLADQVSEQKFKPAFGLKTKEFDFDNLFEIDQTLVGKALNKAVDKITRDIGRSVNKVTWYGKIIRVTEDAIYFTPGSDAGVQLDDVFAVKSRADEGIESEAEPVSEPGEPCLLKVTGFLRNKLSKAELIQGNSVERGDWVVEFKPVESSGDSIHLNK